MLSILHTERVFFQPGSNIANEKEIILQYNIIQSAPGRPKFFDNLNLKRIQENDHWFYKNLHSGVLLPRIYSTTNTKH